MTFYKINCKLLLTKSNILDILLLNYLLSVNVKSLSSSSNRFVSLKSPFHYKLSKNHLEIKSIDLIINCSSDFFKELGNSSTIGYQSSYTKLKTINYKLSYVKF